MDITISNPPTMPKIQLWIIISDKPNPPRYINFLRIA